MTNSSTHIFGPYHTRRYNRNKLTKLFQVSALLIFIFMILEFVGGYYSNSLALMADASHMLTDLISLLLALLGTTISSMQPNSQKTYGYSRGEIIISLFNAIFLIVVCIFIAYEAVLRFLHPQVVNSLLMLPIAIAGLIINFIVMYLFHRANANHSHAGAKHHHHSSADKTSKKPIKNLLVQSAFLHFLTDALGSVIAIIVAITIYYTNWYIVDPLLSTILVLMILRSTFMIMKESIHILMEGSPYNIEAKTIAEYLENNIKGVSDIHHIHLWSLNEEDHLITLHAVIEPNYKFDEVMKQLTIALTKKFHLVSVTVQAESKNNCLDKLTS